MAGKPEGRPKYDVACGCGAKMTLVARAFGRPQRCESCEATLIVAWGRDTRTQRTIPVIVSQQEAVRAGVTAKETPYSAICVCGYTRPIAAAQSMTPPKCPGCGKLMAIGKYVPPVQKGMMRKGGKVKPAAPLLPLHLQAPVRTQIKPGSRFFDCVCGEHLLIRADNDKRPLQCMACDRVHILETEAPSRPAPARETKRKAAPATGSKGPPGALPKSAPAARPKAAPEVPPASAPPAPSRPLGLGEFLCKCGEIHPPRTSRTGRNFECKKCGRKGHVEAETDPQTRLPKMRPVFTFEPAPGAAPPPAAREVPAPRPAPAPKAPAAPPPPPEAGVVAFEELAPLSLSPLEAAPVPDLETAIFERSASSPGSDAPPAVESDAQIAICECGAEILVSPRDVGHTIQCPACSDVMTVEQNPDPRTRMPVLGVRSLGSMDDPNWKLEDFK
ncbi:MAG TPA: hypothetical protein VM222_02815 [Planctomycetota bacterium]|nr:hypothetical protein [Planctomycetota bacterium]